MYGDKSEEFVFGYWGLKGKKYFFTMTWERTNKNWVSEDNGVYYVACICYRNCVNWTTAILNHKNYFNFLKVMLTLICCSWLELIKQRDDEEMR